LKEKIDKGLIVFEEKNIRRIWFKEVWWFVLEDIVVALTDSKDPKQYIQKMKQRDISLSEGWVQIVLTLSIETPGGAQKMNCVNTEGAFRIIQSIPSKKAEPFKLWLARVGYERVQEIEDPELAQKRMKEIYKAKGYSDDWIEKRVRGIAIRDELKTLYILQMNYLIMRLPLNFLINISSVLEKPDYSKESTIALSILFVLGAFAIGLLILFYRMRKKLKKAQHEADVLAGRSN